MPATNNSNNYLKHFIDQLQQRPGGIWILTGLAGLGVLLMLTGGQKEEVKTDKHREVGEMTTQKATTDRTLVEKELETELAKTLEQISGVGKVTVEVNLKTGNRKIWERQSKLNRRSQQQQNDINTEESSSDEIVLANGRDGKDSPILKEELAPEVEGVIVVATGASNLQVKELLTQTVMTILNLPSHRVIVLVGKEN